MQIQVRRTRHSKGRRERHLRTYVHRDPSPQQWQDLPGRGRKSDWRRTSRPNRAHQGPFPETALPTWHADGVGGVWGKMADSSGQVVEI